MSKLRFCLVLMILLMILSTVSIANAGEIITPTPLENTYVYNEDELFDKETERTINNMLVELERKTGIEFVVYSVKTLGRNTIETYANKVFNTWGLGKKGQDNGLLLIMSRSDKRVRIETGRGMERLFTAGKCGQILDQFFVPQREKDDYIQATTLTVQAMINVIADDKGVTIDGTDSNVKVKDTSEAATFLLFLKIAFWVLVITGAFDIGRKVFGYNLIFFGSDGLYMALIEGLASGSSSGGSGGSSGGGFGGGFSGGGGASR